jgi:predicted Zn-dependent protease
MRDDERLELAIRALGNGGGDGIEAVVSDSHLALTRFTNSAIHQNVDELETSIQIRAVLDGRAGWASTNNSSESALKWTRERALAQARFAPKRDVPVTLPAAATYIPPQGAFDEATANAPPALRAQAAASIFERTASVGAWAAGYVSSMGSGIAIANTNGVRAAFSQTDAETNVKCVAPTASGYAEAVSRRIAGIDATAVAARAAEKARAGADASVPELGQWTAIVEPAALGELMAYLLSHFAAERVHSGASFLSEGVDRLYAGENVTLVDDYAHPLHASCPFDGEGTPTERVTLLENGVGRAFVTDTEWATRMKCRNTGHHGFGTSFADGPHVRNPVLMPGSRSRDDLVASTKHGMLITRFWYIRVVDQRKTIVTGMTRDGNFLIRDGKLAGGLRNVRFNVNILELLRACEFSSEQVRTGGYSYSIVVPAAKFTGFTVSSVASY